MENVSENYLKFTQLQSIHASPDFYGAVNTIVTADTMLLNNENKLIDTQATYSPLLLKMFDELIVNCCDQQVRYPKQVKEIIINWTGEMFSIYNNGPTVPVIKHKEYNIYIPQLTFCEFLSSSNYDVKNRITGGKNGIGAKLANAFSSKFIIECNDTDNKLYYIQHCDNCMETINDPIITPHNTLGEMYNKSFTRISLIPNWELVGYKQVSDEDRLTINKLLYVRCIFASIASGIGIVYNNTVVNCNLLSLSNIILRESRKKKSDEEEIDTPKLLEFTVKNTNKVYNWDVIVTFNKDCGFKQISIINGIYCSKGGTHIKWLLNQLISKEYRSKIIAKYGLTKWSSELVNKHLMILVKASIPDPMFDSQTKEELKSPDDFPEHTITTKVIKEFNDIIINILDEALLDKKTTTKRTTIIKKADKYERAEMSGSVKEAHKCGLFIPEGDSAALLISGGIVNKHVGMGGYKYYGIFNIQGKPMNARKESTVKIINGKKYIIRNKLLENFERWNSLVGILNLNYSYTYDMTPEGNLQFNKLTYGHVIIAVDQDVDGVGHICGLILNFFHRFFPNLIVRGFVKRLATPIIRAYPKQHALTVKSFYTDDEYREWTNSITQQDLNKYEIKYYKGLAGHEGDDVIDIFKNFTSKLYTYTLDDVSDRLFMEYFDDESSFRKYELMSEIVPFTPINNTITCTQHLQYHTKEYFLDHIYRSLPHIIDGLRPAIRKVLSGAIDKFSRENHPVKIFQLGGYVTEKKAYDKGDKSLNDIIIKSAQKFPGAKHLPFLVDKGQFGARKMGTDTKYAGKPRYCSTKLNSKLVNALYPRIDDFLLKYEYSDDGKTRCEPLYYVPVLPTCMLESFSSPATGWASNIWAREISSVIYNVRVLIMCSGDYCKAKKNMIDMPIWFPYINAPTHTDKHKFTQTAIYTYDKNSNTIIISEMPYGLWPGIWASKYIEDPLVDNIIDNSDDYSINIRIVLNENAIETIRDTKKNKSKNTLDPIIRYFGLYINGYDMINVVGTDKLIKECNQDYDILLLTWFAERKDLYAKRIDRRTIQLRYLIIMLENQVRYADNYTSYNLSGKSSSAANNILKDNNYIALNKSHIESPAYTELDELEAYFTIDADYKYLLRLTDEDRLDVPNQDRRKKLEEYKNELIELQMENKYFKGSDLWLKEIQIAETVIDEGLRTNWTFGEKYKWN